MISKKDDNGAINIKQLLRAQECYISENYDRYITYLEKHPDMSIIDIITDVNANLDYPFYSNIRIINNPSSFLVLCNKYNQLPSSYEPNDLREIDQTGYLLRDSAVTAFEEMSEAAACDDIPIKPVSAYRSYNYQNQVYWKPEKIKIFFGKDINLDSLSNSGKDEYMKWRDKVSARAGFSEHQTGLAVDINSLSVSFECTKAGKWLTSNAYKFGYILRYPKGKENITGYNFEPWHYRFVGKCIAVSLNNSGLTYDEFYVRYIEPVVRNRSNALKLTGDEFYIRFLARVFIKQKKS